ncbi:NAD(P)/FAD-dependent oxidoreductase [Gordonia sp. OPL2]|uniref:flavin-containing monooxygenase n=1 Tax=Gordonia sp. OPL2 TaxID=2486274 RepID=UPI00292A3CF4|nr:NAD(P)/FAD-dependent oxidoreductase [Gordonia sp. OPL2]
MVGAGIAGLYALHRLRSDGWSVRVFEAGPDIGGVWFWNRYPGARCDVESVDYSYSFDTALQQEWDWSEKYATQPEILRYLHHVADRFDLRRDITLDTRVVDMSFDESSSSWTVRTDRGEEVTSRFCVLAVGPLSSANIPEIPGLDSFSGQIVHTSSWPEDVDLTGRRVGVIGTGSSGIQAIPHIAREAGDLYVFQRTANFSIPAGNRPLDAQTRAQYKRSYDERRRLSMESGGGSPHRPHPESALAVTDDERRIAYEKRWQLGGVLFSKTFPDQLTDRAANDTARSFWEQKIRAVVDDPAVAERLIPGDHPIGAKRICTDDNYFETYNRANVHLVDVRQSPIDCVVAEGIRTAGETIGLDVIVLATGFDAMTGSIDRINIVGRDGQTLKQAWSAGPRTYLGLGVDGFPNLFNIAGPGSPSVLANMVLHAELHVDWVADAIGHLDAAGRRSIEATTEAVDAWVADCADRADNTLMPQANSWYLGANVPGRPRVFMPFVGGFGVYREIIADVAADGYRGFALMPAEELT